MDAQAIVTAAMRSTARLVQAFGKDEDGATAIEYSLIVGLIFLAIVASVRAFSSSTSEMYNTIDSTLQDANDS